MRLSGLTFILFFVFSANLQAKNIHFITVNNVDSWEEIVLLCRQKNVPIFVMYTNEPKTPENVKAFQKNSKEVKFVNKTFVSVYINDYSQLGETFKSLFELSDENYYMVLNPQEELLVKQKKIDLSFFEEGQNRFQRFKEIMLKHYNRTLTKEEWLIYLDIKYNNFGYLGTITEANRFVSKLNESDLSNPKVWPFVTKLCLDLNNAVLQTIRKNKTLVENSEEKFPWLDYYINAYNLNLSFAIENKDPIRIARMKEELIPLFPDTAKREYQKLLVEQQYLADLDKWEGYKKLTFSYLEKNNKPDDFYNEFEKLNYGYPFNAVSDLLEEILEKGIEEKSTFKLNYNMAQLLIAKDENVRAWFYANEAAKRTTSTKEQTKAVLLLQYLQY